MIARHSLILFGFVLIPFSKGEGIWKLDVKQSPKSSEKQIPGKLLWTLSTPTGLSCAALCLQKTECVFYGYQNHVCHGYLGSEARSSPVEMSVIFQGHFRRCLKRKRRNLKDKDMKGQEIRDPKSRIIKEKSLKDYKSKGIKDQAIKDPKSKGKADPKSNVVDDGYIQLTSRNTHLFVKKHQDGEHRDEALEVCQAEGATLVKLDTRKKVRLFRKAFRDRHVEQQSFWIGLSDRYDNNTWYWTDGTRLGRYSNWDFKEPDHRYDGKKENCVGIVLRRFYSGKWFDSPCSRGNNFVCERV